MTETESEKTPLQQKLDEFGQQLSKASQPLSGVSLSSLILLHFLCSALRKLFTTVVQ